MSAMPTRLILIDGPVIKAFDDRELIGQWELESPGGVVDSEVLGDVTQMVFDVPWAMDAEKNQRFAPVTSI